MTNEPNKTRAALKVAVDALVLLADDSPYADFESMWQGKCLDAQKALAAIRELKEVEPDSMTARIEELERERDGLKAQLDKVREVLK